MAVSHSILLNSWLGTCPDKAVQNGVGFCLPYGSHAWEHQFLTYIPKHLTSHRRRDPIEALPNRQLLAMTQALPPDIVHEIFKDYATPYRLTMRQSRARHSAPSHVFPWFLGHVCSLWRSVFMSMHREFWGRYILYPSDAPESIRMRIVEQTQFFLERNRGKPFSFEILSVIPKDCTCILEMLVAESVRWVDVSLVITDRQVPLLSPVQNRLPLLRSLSIDKGATCVPVTCEGVFSNSPRLKHLTLSSVSTWRFNLSSLTSLRLTRHNDLLLNILPQMNDLEELFIPRSVLDTSPFPNKEATSILLPRLKSLSVSEIGFLLLLNTPSLKHLCIDLERYSSGWTSPTALTSLFERSSCELEHLTLGDCVPSVLPVILPHTPSLRSLKIGYSAFSGPGDYFSFLTCSWETSMLASQLETLRVTLGTPTGVASKPLLSLIKSRTTERPTSSVRRLKQLVLILSGNMTQRDLLPLGAVHRLCESCGVDFQFEKSMDAPFEDGEGSEFYRRPW